MAELPALLSVERMVKRAPAEKTGNLSWARPGAREEVCTATPRPALAATIEEQGSTQAKALLRGERGACHWERRGAPSHQGFVSPQLRNARQQEFQGQVASFPSWRAARSYC